MVLYRQGDIVLRCEARLPERAREVEDRVLARGEATGHAHRVVGDAALFRDPESQRLWLKVMSAATLEHEEHGPITLGPGIYRIVRQREYAPKAPRAIRRVWD